MINSEYFLKEREEEREGRKEGGKQKKLVINLT